MGTSIQKGLAVVMMGASIYQVLLIDGYLLYSREYGTWKQWQKDALHLTKSDKRKDSLQASEKFSLTKLWACSDIVTKPVDKVSATVVMSKEAYLAEAHTQLSDSMYCANWR